MPRSADGHQTVRWLWTSRRPDARIVRALLVPVAGLWSSTMRFRALAYRRGWFKTRALPLPAVAVGNLTVGGSGKTPLAGWIAGELIARGRRPAILLRDVGGDESAVHREALPGVIVVPDADRARGADVAMTAGADVLVLDDAFQRLNVGRDLNVCLISAETTRAVRWPLPAGPWREGLRALDRADLVIVTRKRADAETAARLAEQLRHRTGTAVAVAHLALTTLRGLVSGRPHPLAVLQGRRVVAASAIADPASFVAQIKQTGAQVQVATWNDHHAFRDEDLAWLAHAARRADWLVVTAKDAVKLRDRWPASVPEPLVAMLSIAWEAGESHIHAALDRMIVPRT